MDRTDGRALAFAASTHESTGEEWVPPGAPLRAGRLHSVFTFHFAAALIRAEQPTLIDLQRIVREGYARERRAEPSRHRSLAGRRACACLEPDREVAGVACFGGARTAFHGTA